MCLWLPAVMAGRTMVSTCLNPSKADLCSKAHRELNIAPDRYDPKAVWSLFFQREVAKPGFA